MLSDEGIKLRLEQDFPKCEIQHARRAASVHEAKVAAANELIESIFRHCEEVSANNHCPVILVVEAQGTCFLRGLDSAHMTIHWHGRHSTSLEGSNVKVAIYEGPPSLFGNMVIKNGKCLRTSTFAFGLLSQNRAGFFEGNERYDAQQLAEKLIKWYLDEGARASQRQMR